MASGGASGGGIPPEVLKMIITEVRNTRTSRYNELALDVLYIYDYVTTLDLEVELVWFRPMSLMQILFFLVRYLPLFSSFFNACIFLYEGLNLSSNNSCGHWFKFQSGQAIVVLAFIQTILVMRIWAIYHRNKKLLIGLAIFGVLQLVASGVIMGISVTEGTPESQPGPGFVVCTMSTPPYFAAYWIPILAFELTLFLLTVANGWMNLRKTTVSVLSGRSGYALLTVLVRDSVIYFALISAVYIANAAVWQWAEPSLYEASSVYGINLPPIIAAKLLFSLRSFDQEEKTMTNHELSTFRATHGSSNPSTLTAVNSNKRDQWDEWGHGSDGPSSLRGSDTTAWDEDY